MFSARGPVDRGRVPELVHEQNPDLSFDIPVSPPYFEGRYSNGPTYVERLPHSFGLPDRPGAKLRCRGSRDRRRERLRRDAAGTRPAARSNCRAWPSRSMPSWRPERRSPPMRLSSCMAEPSTMPTTSRRTRTRRPTRSPRSGRDHLQHRRGHPSLGRRRRTHLRRSERGLHEGPDTGTEQTFSQLHEQAINSEMGSFAAESASRSWSPTSPRELNFLSAPRKLLAG